MTVMVCGWSGIAMTSLDYLWPIYSFSECSDVSPPPFNVGLKLRSGEEASTRLPISEHNSRMAGFKKLWVR